MTSEIVRNEISTKLLWIYLKITEKYDFFGFRATVQRSIDTEAVDTYYYASVFSMVLQSDFIEIEEKTPETPQKDCISKENIIVVQISDRSKCFGSIMYILNKLRNFVSLKRKRLIWNAWE